MNNLKKLEFVGLLLICFNVTVFILLFFGIRGCEVKPYPNSSKLMPNGFGNMYLGMDETELLKMRGLGYDSESNLYNIRIENIGIKNPNYDFIQFMNFSEQISFIRLSGTGSSEYLIGFLDGCIEKWGREFEKRIIIINARDSSYYYPMLYWKKEDAKIFASYRYPFNGERIVKDSTYYAVEFYAPDAIRLWWAYGKVRRVSKEQEIYFDQIDNIDSLIKNYSGPVFH